MVRPPGKVTTYSRVELGACLSSDLLRVLLRLLGPPGELALDLGGGLADVACRGALSVFSVRNRTGRRNTGKLAS